MMFDTKKFTSDVNHALSNMPTSFEKREIRTEFIEKVQDALNNLHKGYQDDNNVEKNTGDHDLIDAYNYLRRHLQVAYILSHSNEDQTLSLNRIISYAFSELNLPDQNESVQMFFIARKQKWLDIFLQMINKKDFDLESLLGQMVDIISADFTNDVELITDRDIYLEFHTKLQMAFDHLKKNIESEACIDLVIAKVKQHAPISYQTIPPPKASVLDETHPANTIGHYHRKFMNYIKNGITPEFVKNMLVDHIAELNLHKSYLATLTPGTDITNIINAMRRTHILRLKIHKAVHQKSREQAFAILVAYINKIGIQMQGELVLSYDNYAPIRECSLQIYNEVIKILNNHFDLSIIYSQESQTEKNGVNLTF